MAYREGTCALPYPPADPASHAQIMAHCYQGRKCWWFEGACYNAHPANARYPHRNGAVSVFGATRESHPEMMVGVDTIAACKEDKWRLWNARPDTPVADLRGPWCNDLDVLPDADTTGITPDFDCSEDIEDAVEEEDDP